MSFDHEAETASPAPPTPAGFEGGLESPEDPAVQERPIRRRLLTAIAVVLVFVLGIAIGRIGMSSVQTELDTATSDLEDAKSEATQARADAEAAATRADEADAKAVEAPRKKVEEESAEPQAHMDSRATELDEREAALDEREGAPESAATWRVVGIVDGDTIDVARDGTEERVRVIGIDTPERGECGFDDASTEMAALVSGKDVVLTPGARDDRDRYDRILRYVDVTGNDAGLALIDQGLAIARYDSRDGYGRHPRQDTYVAADAATAQVCTQSAPDPAVKPEPQPGTQPDGGSVYYKNCTAARDAGAAPVRRGDPGYASHLDRDNDGVGCE